MSQDNTSHMDQPKLKISSSDKELLRIKLAELEILEDKVSKNELSGDHAQNLIASVLQELNEIEERILRDDNLATLPNDQPPVDETYQQEIPSDVSELKVIKSTQNLKPWGNDTQEDDSDLKITLKEDETVPSPRKSSIKKKPEMAPTSSLKRKKSRPNNKSKFKNPTKKPRVQKKKPFPISALIFLSLIVLCGYFYNDAVDYIKKQRAELAEKNKPKVKKSEEPKKVIQKKAPVKKAPKEVVQTEEAVEVDEEEVDNSQFYNGEIKHYSFNQVLRDNCVQCHGKEGEKVEGKLNIVKLMASPNANIKTWTKIYHSVNKGEMPPEDDAPVLDFESKELVLSSIKHMHDNLKLTATTRVLTPVEIQNTMVDLFNIDLGTYNPFKTLANSYSEKEFHTGQRKVLSPYYITEYYKILYDVLQSFIGLRPQVDKLDLKVAIPQHVLMNKKLKNHVELRWHQAKDKCRIEFDNKEKIKEPKKNKTDGNQNEIVNEQLERLSLPAGTYTLRFKAATKNMNLNRLNVKKHGQATIDAYKNALKDLDDTLSIPINFYRTPPDVSDFHGSTELLETVHISSEGEYAIEFTLDRRAAVAYSLNWKSLPAIGTANNLLAHHILGEDYEVQDRERIRNKFLYSNDYIFPAAKMWNFRIEGPYDVKLHPLSFDTETRVGTTEVSHKFKFLHQFLGLKNNIIYGYIFKDFQTDKMKYEDAYRNALIMLFLSSDFLTVNRDVKSPDFTRFSSYSLLKSAPNEAFTHQFTQTKKRRDSEALSKWLIKHPNFERFLKPFVYQWLKLGEIQNNLPDEQDFSVFYAKNLRDAYRIEAEKFMLHLFRKNRPISELLSANYSFVNEDLKNFYSGQNTRARLKRSELPPSVNPDDFKLHTFTDPKRGGLLSMGAFLTATGNGVDPLPIRRAAWVSENLLDSPLPNPPDVDVSKFELDKSANTLRQRLEAHTQNPACHSCHKRLDPLAILLDRYNTIGGDNHHFRQETVMINQQKVNSLGELKQYLKSHEHNMARAFSKKLISYMLGRHVNIADEKYLDAIIRDTKEGQFRMGDIYQAIIKYYYLEIPPESYYTSTK